MAKYTPSSSKAKALSRAWLEFRKLARAIRGQAALLKTVRTNSAMDVPSAWLEQIEDLRQSLEVLRDEVAARAAEIPDGAHPRVLADRDRTLESMEAEFRALYEELFGGIKTVQSLLNDPTRTATTFSGSFLDYISTAADLLEKYLSRRRAKKKRK